METLVLKRISTQHNFINCGLDGNRTFVSIVIKLLQLFDFICILV